MGYRLYRVLEDGALELIRWKDEHGMCVESELETEDEIVNKIMELCMTTELTLNKIKVMQELEVGTWEVTKNGSNQL